MEESGAGAVDTMRTQEMEMKQAEEERLRVMVAIDESDESMHALHWALENLFRRDHAKIAPEYSSEETGTSVLLAHVQPPYQHYLFPAGSAAVMESLKRAQQENSAAVLSRALSICKRKMVGLKQMLHLLYGRDGPVHMVRETFALDPDFGVWQAVKAETLILDGEPKEMICEAVERKNIDLLVTGCRGLTALKRAFLGSVSDYCAQHANCPILIVKQPKPDALAHSSA